jgi:hypothetical protein
MNPKSIALALRTAAEALERAKQLAADLPARFVDDTAAMALAFDAPRVVLALATVAGSLDPAGTADDDVLDLEDLRQMKCG